MGFCICLRTVALLNMVKNEWAFHVFKNGCMYVTVSVNGRVWFTMFCLHFSHTTSSSHNNRTGSYSRFMFSSLNFGFFGFCKILPEVKGLEKVVSTSIGFFKVQSWPFVYQTCKDAFWFASFLHIVFPKITFIWCKVCKFRVLNVSIYWCNVCKLRVLTVSI